ncbi:MAG: hypothetical protein LC118_19930 [Dehalococcoidia bacterium]|nr:hypothetical protein [Dehalococcoidia bacterium]
MGIAERASSGVAAKVLHAPGPWSVAATGALVEVLPRDVALMPVLSTSSVVVCAGGVTMLESMMCGRPTLALETATNQRRAVVGATVAGAVVTSDVADPSLVASAAAELLADADRSQRLARAAQRLVDGRGADRVAVAIDELLDVQPT